nr:hypothetical protein [Tanacetum cinerariifolium]
MSLEGRDVEHKKVTNKVGTGVSTNTNNDVMDAMRSDVVNNDLRVIAKNIHDELTKGDNVVEIDDVTGSKSEEDTGPDVLNTTDSTCLDSAKESMAVLSSTTGNKNFKTILVKPKPLYRPKAKQSDEGTSNSPKTTHVVGTNKASTSGYNKDYTTSPSNKERINVYEKQMLEGKLVIVDDGGKPLEKVDYSGITGSDDEVEQVDNETASYVASKIDR